MLLNVSKRALLDLLKNKPWLWRAILVFFFGGLFLFVLHDFTVYDPLQGYDAPGHVQHLKYIAEKGELPPPGFYSSSNPPLYYVVASVIWNVTQSLKAVQAMSAVLFLVGIVLLYRVLALQQVPRLGRLGITAYFSLLPLSLNYPLMIFNYVFVNFFSLLLLLVLWHRGSKSPVRKTEAILFAALCTLAILSSLTGLALWAIGFWYLFAFPGLSLSHRRKLTAIFCLTSLLILAPYMAYREKRFGCTFCSLHRGGKSEKWYHPYQPRFYLHFDRSVFTKPYFSPGDRSLDGSNSFLYVTWFGDYWNYLTMEPWEQGQRAVPEKRARNLRLLMWLGIPIALGSIWLVLQRIRALGKWRSVFRADGFQTALPLICGALFYAQFFAYFHRYRESVLMHSGYLWPCLVLFCWMVADRWHRFSPAQQVIVSGYLLLFSGVSAYTFWL